MARFKIGDKVRVRVDCKSYPSTGIVTSVEDGRYPYRVDDKLVREDEIELIEANTGTKVYKVDLSYSPSILDLIGDYSDLARAVHRAMGDGSIKEAGIYIYLVEDCCKNLFSYVIEEAEPTPRFRIKNDA